MFKLLAENIEKLQIKKGQLLCVEGRIRTRSWDDRDGRKHYMTEILAESVNLLGRRMGADPAAHNEGSDTGFTPPAPPPAITEQGPDTTGDLPF